ncbi:MAG: DUF962 domain-containing protein [Bacteriovorax sp.]|nr:DUF962 domain-containing protein [Bacteriovorax sp.]
MKSLKPFKTFDDFWPFYMDEHANPLNRRLHFVGTLTVHLILFYVFATADFKLLWFIPLVGYAFAWFGHLIIEKNRPVTLKHPIWSLMGDFKMFYLILFKKL